MLEIWRRVVVGSAVGVYLVGLVSMGAMLIERIRSAGAPPSAVGRSTEAVRPVRLEPGPPETGAGAVEETRR